MQEYFASLKASILTLKDSSTFDNTFSNFRESYLCDVVTNEMAKYKKIISVNGHMHVFLEKKVKWLYKDDWIPLAYRVKSANPEKKVCSIFLLNLENDKFFRKVFPDEYKYISENTKRGEMYLIKLDYENTPFKNLLSKFTYIGVY